MITVEEIQAFYQSKYKNTDWALLRKQKDEFFENWDDIKSDIEQEFISDLELWLKANKPHDFWIYLSDAKVGRINPKYEVG